MTPILQKAIEYQSRGLSVIPLGKDKRPLLKSWKQYQTAAADEAQLEAWWGKWPSANVGIVTGKVSGITVVDIDVSGDATTPVSAFPPTLTVRTPSGGYHLYYQYDERAPQGANAFPQYPHVDIRNDGGYVVAPPSIAEYTKNKQKIKGTYEVVDKTVGTAPFPIHLFAGVNKKGTPQRPSVAQVLKGFPAMADGDGRNVALTKIAGKIMRLVPAGDHASVAWPMLLAANNQFKKPLDEAEARVIFNSISQKEQGKVMDDIEYVCTDKGNIIPNTENVYRTIVHDTKLAHMFRLNSFNGTLESLFGRTTWEPYQRADVVTVRGYLMSDYTYFNKIGHSDVEDAILRYAYANTVSPPLEWLQSLIWDQTPRVDAWLTSAYGVPQDAYHAAVGSNWLKGLVQRLAYPGSKFDYVLVLEGKQGIGKSTSLGILGGRWHVETVFSPNNKDFFMLFAGNAIVEFSEGETLSRTEAKHLKAVITMQFDKYRPPYERSVKEFPRQCVFAMTTNQATYLKDETGNRRWLPVAIEQQINTQWLRDNREQLFAEAYHRVVVLKETVHEFPADEMARQQEARRIVDPREDTIIEWYYTVLKDEEREAGVTTRQAYVGALNHGFEGVGKQMDKMDEMMISSILRDILKLDRRRGVRGRGSVFFPTIESEAGKPPSKDVPIAVPSNLDF